MEQPVEKVITEEDIIAFVEQGNLQELSKVDASLLPSIRTPNVFQRIYSIKFRQTSLWFTQPSLVRILERKSERY